MSMKFFTLSALCVLMFCMLLALSGTTDINVKEARSSIAKQNDYPGSNFRIDSKNSAIHYGLPDCPGSKNHPVTVTGMETLDGIIQSKVVRLVGALLIIGWIFASFKILFSTL